MFPNFDFIRELKKSLQENEGSIFRYSAHENTILAAIHAQLLKSLEHDRDELCAFIREITTSKDWVGTRNMIDLLELVKKYYYNPRTKGSNSIKHILPAIISSSEYLKNKYSLPIYGAKNGMKSCNFQDWAWVSFKDGEVIDPYHRLPSILQGGNSSRISSIDEINNGGTAMTAYCLMQFTQMNPEERKALSELLLAYCELDTLSMLLIVEDWLNTLR